MNREWKFTLWVGILFLIVFLKNFSTWSQSEASEFIEVLLYGYLFIAGLSLIDFVYKAVKKSYPKKQDI